MVQDHKFLQQNIDEQNVLFFFLEWYVNISWKQKQNLFNVFLFSFAVQQETFVNYWNISFKAFPYVLVPLLEKKIFKTFQKKRWVACEERILKTKEL